MRGDRAVSAKTRERIQQIARDLNYTVDKNASSLRSQRSNTIALLFFEDPTPDESMINPFFLAMLGSITRACADRGLDLLISFQRMEDDWHVQYQDSHRADGLILLGYGDYTVYRKRMDQLEAQGTHFARWGSVSSDSSGVTVGTDNHAAGVLAGRHLDRDRTQGSVAFLGHADEHYRIRGSVCWAVEASSRAGHRGGSRAAIRRDHDRGSWSFCGRGAAGEGGKAFDAVFAASDLIAIGAMRALAEAGLSVPGDVAVVGFDDIPAASLTTPPLTTVMQDIRGAGRALVETLIAQIEDRDLLPPRKLPGKLIVRGSSASC